MRGDLNHVRRGGGEPLLLLHSLGGTVVQWNPVLDLLAAQREVIAVDMPGFGGSAPLPERVEPSAANLAAAVLGFVDSLGLDARPAVAGISLGAWVAIECARQGGVSGAVCLSPAGFWPQPLGPRSNRAYQAIRLMRPLVPLLLRIDSLRDGALATSVHRPERVPFDDAVALVQGYGGARGYVESNRLMRASTVGDLTDVGVPLAIAWAEFDRLVRNRPLPPGGLPDPVRQVTLPGCGHVPTWDDPELVSRVILEGTAARPAGRVTSA
jgi:pimeloyl-ACP methyl ester carboxylesterase